MLTSRELREKLGLSAKRLEALIRRGLPLTKQGRERRFDAAAVAAWLEAQGLAKRTDPPADAAASTRVATTRAEAALALSVNLRTLATWLTDPTFPGKPGSPGRQDGYFPLDEINAWRAAKFGADHRSGEATEQVAAIKLLKTQIECDREQLEFERELGTILDAGEKAAFLERYVAILKAGFAQAPDRAEAHLPAKAGPKTRKVIRRAMQAAIDEAYLFIADMLAREAEGDDNETDASTDDDTPGSNRPPVAGNQ